MISILCACLMAGTTAAVQDAKKACPDRKTIARIDLEKAGNEVIESGSGKIVSAPDGGKCLELKLDYETSGIVCAAFVNLRLSAPYTLGAHVYLDIDIYYEGANDPGFHFDIGSERPDKTWSRSQLHIPGLKAGKWETKTVNLTSMALTPWRGYEKQLPKHGEVMPELGVYADNGRRRGVKRLLLRNIHIYEEDKLAGNPDPNARDAQGLTRLHRAVLSGNKDEVARLLQQGGNPQAKDKEDNGPIHLAAKAGRSEIAKLLLDKKVPADAPGRQGWTALHFAAYDGHVDTVRVLLDGGANKNLAVWSGMTPLFWAIRQGQRKVVELLLDRGVDIEAETGGIRPLHLAAQGSSEGPHEEMVKLLLSRGARKDIFFSAAMGDVDQVKAFLKTDPALATAQIYGGWTPLHDAAKGGHFEIAQILLDHKADVNAKAGQSNASSTPLHQAAYFRGPERAKRQTEVAKLLISRGANINAGDHRGNPPFVYAKGTGHGLMVNLLREHRAEERPPK